MVERESSQALPVLNQQLMNSWDIVKLVQSNTVEENQTSETNVQSEAESLGSTFLNADLDEITNTIYLHESENPNIFSETELSLMNQHDVDFNLTNENSHYDIIPDPFSNAHDHYMELGSPVSLWGCPMDLDVLKMDDVFQVDKADLVQSPTLAELNANDESLFDSFDSFELSSFSESKASTNPNSLKLQTENVSSSLIISSLQNNQTDIKESSNKLSDLKVAVSYEELAKSRNTLSKCDNLKSDSEDTIKTQLKSSPCDAKLQTVPSISLDVIAKQISTKPPSLENQTKIESQHDSIKSDFKVEYKQPKTVNIKQMTQLNEEAYDSDEEDSDMDFFNSSDAESMDEQPKTSTSSLLLEKKRSRYFWQYNIQSKGPKGPKAKLYDSQNSFPNFPNIRDPVFSSHEMEGVRHAGKARRGDGNDLTPNPRKLYTIGIELQKLNSIIEDLVPVNELPFNVRTKSRKEKNKLASRACRLKKKAQHEANKLKLFGLQQEQKILLNSMREARKLVKEAFDVNLKLNKQVMERIKDLTSKSDFTKVAGHSADFVNSVLEKVANGDSTGGLSGLQSHVN